MKTPKQIHPPFRELVRDQLVGLPGVRFRPRRRVRGLYYGGACFAVMDEYRLYFRTDSESKAEFEALGMKCYDRFLDASLGAYYEVPMEIVDDRSKLAKWARRAIKTFEETLAQTQKIWIAR